MNQSVSPRRNPARSAARTLHLLTLASTFAATGLQAASVAVNIRNLAPANGTYLTPFWVGFHNGTFDLFSAGSPASAGLERLAEDGNTAVVSGEFAASGAGTTQGTILSSDALFPPFAPMGSGAMVFSVNPFDPQSRYLSFASMVIPSNDAFIGNGDPMAIEVFNGLGSFVGGTFTIYGSMVYDAGTEVNDELPANTAFFGQAAGNTGTDEGGTVALHAGFQPAGSGGILDDPMFANANFKNGVYPLAEITVSAVPEPHHYAGLAAFGLAGFATWRRSRKR